MREKSRLDSARVWVAAAVCLLALLPSAAANNPPGESNRSCSAICYDRYYTCLVAGNSQSYCQRQYQYCLANCGTNPLTSPAHLP